MNPDMISGGFFDPANDDEREPLTEADYEPLYDD